LRCKKEKGAPREGSSNETHGPGRWTQGGGKINRRSGGRGRLPSLFLDKKRRFVLRIFGGNPVKEGGGKTKYGLVERGKKNGVDKTNTEGRRIDQA